MSCAGLCRCFTLTRANRIVSYNAIGWQQGKRCTATSVNILRKYNIKHDDTHAIDRYRNNLLHRRFYSSSISSIFSYNNSLHGITREEWLHISKTLSTPSQGICQPCLSVHQRHSVAVLPARCLHSTSRHGKELAESDTKIESTVKHLKERKKEKEEEAKKEATTPVSPEVKVEPSETLVLPKKTIMQRIKAEILHYWHGFRLLGLDMKVSGELLWRVLNGKALTRREYRQFIRTVVDMIRLVPFLVFILIPFMEFLLPVAVKLFPNMLPSTFEDKSKRESKMKTELKLKLEMAKFIQDSIEDTPLVKRKSKGAKKAHEFANFIAKIRTSGEQASNEEIVKFSKLFENELTLDNLSRDQLIALCRLLRLKPFGTNDFLRFQLRMQLRNLMLDDKMIVKEGVDTLTTPELQTACQARGMRAIGVPVERLKSQLQQWLDLHLNEHIPTSLLLLSRALYLPDNLPVTEQLKETIKVLPEKTASEAKIKLSELAGEKVSNTERLAVIREEDDLIHQEREMRRAEEREDLEKKRLLQVEAEAARVFIRDQEIAEQMEEAQAKVAEEIAAAREVLIDTAPIIKQEPVILQFSKKPEIVEDVSKEEIKELQEAISEIAEEKVTLLKEKEQVEELKEDISEYKEDLEDLRKEAVVFEESLQVEESTASTRLSKQVGRLLNRVENIVDELEKEKDVLEMNKVSLTADLRQQQEGLHEDRDHKEEQKMEEAIDTMRKDIVSVEELMESIRKITKVTDEVKLRNILREMDVNEDGNIDIGEVIKALDTISKEKIALNTKQIGDIMDILDKEETIELETPLTDLKDKLENGVKSPAAAATIQNGNGPIIPPSSSPPTPSGGAIPPTPVSDVKKTEELKQ